jgi:hypothetical protein
MRYYANNPPPVTPFPLSVGDRVKFVGDRRWWTVKAVTDNFAALTRQAEFERAGTLCYTVVDWRNGVRGACDLLGQGWGDGSYTEAECAEMLAAFEVPPWDPDNLDPNQVYHHRLEVSQRNWVPIEFAEVPAATQ